MINILSWLKDTFTSRISDQDIEALQDSVKVLNYELSLLRYKDIPGNGYRERSPHTCQYTDMNDGHGIHSLRHSLVRASNIKQS